MSKLSLDALTIDALRNRAAQQEQEDADNMEDENEGAALADYVEDEEEQGAPNSDEMPQTEDSTGDAAAEDTLPRQDARAEQEQDARVVLKKLHRGKARIINLLSDSQVEYCRTTHWLPYITDAILDMSPRTKCYFLYDLLRLQFSEHRLKSAIAVSDAPDSEDTPAPETTTEDAPEAPSKPEQKAPAALELSELAQAALHLAETEREKAQIEQELVALKQERDELAMCLTALKSRDDAANKRAKTATKQHDQSIMRLKMLIEAQAT